MTHPCRAGLLVTISLLAAQSLFATPASPQEESALPARVLFVSGERIQIDLGQEAAVEPGNVVWFHPLGGVDVRGTVQSVQQRSAWVQVSRADHGIDLGTQAEVRITPRDPAARDPDGHLRDPDARLPQSPPRWSAPEEPWDPSLPLLTELPRAPEERESHWSGRVYAFYDSIREHDPRSSSSTFGRLGAGLRGDNPFAAGGSLRLDFDLDARSFSAPGEGTDRDQAARLERMAYSRGGDRDHPLRWQVGRFLPAEFPEFGVLDGAEWSYRLAGGDRVGASLGYLPEPGQDYASGKDFQVAASYRAFHGAQRQFTWAAGVQKSWHRGAPDRDLAILQADYLAASRFTWRNSAWIDFYGNSDVAKNNGPEITLWNSFLTWDGERSGSSVGFRHWRFPQLRRFQGGFFFESDLIDARTSRVDGSAWYRVNGSLRLSGRVDVWRSESRDGKGADLRMDARALLGPSSLTWAGLYYHEGSDNDAGGVRFGHGHALGPGRARLSWDSTRYRPLDDEGSLLQHDLRLAWDYWGASGWSLSLDAGRRFGDDQDSYSIGIFLQRTF